MNIHRKTILKWHQVWNFYERICSHISMKAKWKWMTYEYIYTHTQCVRVLLTSTYSRWCSVSVMSSVPLAVPVIVVMRANKTGWQTEVSIIELLSTKAFTSTTLVSCHRPALWTSSETLPIRNPLWICLVSKALRMHLQRLL